MQIIFVFGSNLAGRHGKGAALYAQQYYGAELGVGQGLTGNAYAIPTKDRDLKVLPMLSIESYITRFIEFARSEPNMLFLLTPVGCGLAGYKRFQIWAILKRVGLPKNVALTSTWVTE